MIRGENPGVGVLMHVMPVGLAPKPSDDGVWVSNEGRQCYFQSVWAGEGFPLDVRRALDSIHSMAPNGTPVVTARRMSVGAIDELTKAGMSWADAAGYATITDLSGLYIARLRPAPMPSRETMRITWSPSVDAIAEYVLSQRAKVAVLADVPGFGVERVGRIAGAVGTSAAQAARVLVSFDEEGYTAKFGPERGPNSMREWRNPSRLLSDWAGHSSRGVRKEQRAELHVLDRDPAAWDRLVAGRLQGMRWATSGWVAADVIAPYATTLPDMTLYVAEADFDAALERLTVDSEVSEVERGGRIHLRSAADPVLTFIQTVGGRPVVSPIRVYADLLRIGGRGAEAAEHLREVRIGF